MTTTPAPTTSAPTAGPSAYLVYSDDGLVFVEAGGSTVLVDEPVVWAAGDGGGGVVFQRYVKEAPTFFWLRADAKEPERLPIAADRGVLAFVDGRSSLYYWRWSGEGDVVAYDLRSGKERVVPDAGFEGQDGGSSPVSGGGDLVVGIRWEAMGCAGTDLGLAFYEVGGGDADVPTNPFPRSCAPCQLGALLSPEGDLLAYSHRPDAPWPPEEMEPACDFASWWGESSAIEAEVVVLDLANGRKLFRMRVPAWQARLLDFDGRYLVLADVGEDREGPVVSVILDTSGEAEPLRVPGSVALLRDI